MAQAGAGVGIGVKQLRVVMVFHNREALNNFIKNGYVLGADASIAAKYGDTGGAPVSGSVNTVTPSAEKLDPPVNVYQLTEDGLSLQAMVDGYKYWPDTELN
ncbi:TPA: YSC84-related protein [Serratia fonticola]